MEIVKSHPSLGVTLMIKGEEIRMRPFGAATLFFFIGMCLEIQGMDDKQRTDAIMKKGPEMVRYLSQAIGKNTEWLDKLDPIEIQKLFKLMVEINTRYVNEVLKPKYEQSSKERKVREAFGVPSAIQ